MLRFAYRFDTSKYGKQLYTKIGVLPTPHVKILKLQQIQTTPKRNIMYHTKPSLITTPPLRAHSIFNMKYTRGKTHSYRPSSINTTQKRFKNEPDTDDIQPDGYKKSEATRRRVEPIKPATGRIDRSLPLHERTPGNWFRRGIDVPRITSDHWLNRLILEPGIAARGHWYVWLDTNLRFTRVGFYLLHFTGLFAALFGAYFSSEYIWGDVQIQLDKAHKLYLLDVAALLWIREAMRNCQLVIDKRPGGIIPGLTISEAAAVEKERLLHTHDRVLASEEITDRAMALNKFYQEQYNNQHAPHPNSPEAKAEKLRQERVKLQSRQQMQEELIELTRKEKYFEEKRRAIAEHDQRGAAIREQQEQLKTNVQDSKKNFRKQYITPYVKVDI